MERENRREADAIQREFLAKQIGKLKSDMQTVQEDLLSQGNLAVMDPFDRISNKLDRIVERIRHAARGYAGFFDAVKVNEEELDRIYQYDLSLVDGINSAEEALQAVSSVADQGGDLQPVLRSMRSRVDEVDAALDEREKILKGVG